MPPGYPPCYPHCEAYYLAVFGPIIILGFVIVGAVIYWVIFRVLKNEAKLKALSIKPSTKQVSQTLTRIETQTLRHFNFGIIGIILLISNFSLTLVLNHLFELFSQIAYSELVFIAGVLFVLMIGGLLLVGIAFYGYRLLFSSKLLPATIIITICLAVILSAATILGPVLTPVTGLIFRSGIFEFLLIGIIFLFWGSTFWIIRKHWQINTFSKAMSILLIISGFFSILYPILLSFAGLFIDLSLISIDFYQRINLILQICRVGLFAFTLVLTAFFLHQSKEFLA